MQTRCALIAVLCVAAHGQTPTFEASSVKPPTRLGAMGLRSDRKGGPGTADPTLYTCVNCLLYWVLDDAFAIHDYDFSGPDWLQTTRFDFFARVPAGATKEEFQAMLRNLFVERFQMAVHRETRQIQVYDLTVARNGPKFKPSKSKDAPADDGPSGPLKKDPDGFPILPPGMIFAIIPGRARLQSENQTMAWLAGQLSQRLHQPVNDATALTGAYDFTLSWSWEENSPEADAAAVADLVNAVQSQLGLRLERKKGPVEVLVVDHMEKTPTKN